VTRISIPGAPPTPTIIGIAGPSCSGKSTLATLLAEALPGINTVLPLDAYYRDLSTSPSDQRSRTNFDTPSALEFPLILDHVGRLAHGQPVERPVYDFATHTRTTERVLVAPGRYLVVEGLFALRSPALLARYTLAVFIDTPDAICLQRRIARDTEQRQRSAGSVRRQFAAQTRPMFDRYGRPSREAADLVLDGRLPLETNVRVLIDVLEQSPGQSTSRRT